MPRVGLEPTIPAFERAKTVHALDCASTVTGNSKQYITLQNWLNVGSEVLTAVVMKSPIFWDKPPCSPLKVHRRFGGT
jgi:hypothetical protein